MHRQLNFAEACARLRIPEERLREAVKYGDVPCRKTGGEVYFVASELDAWGSQRIMSLRGKDLLPEHTASTHIEVKNPREDVLLPQLIRPEFVSMDLGSKTRKSVIRNLVDMAEGLELLCDPADLLHQLEEREAVSSTALPGGIALLHPHHPDPYLITEPFMLVTRNARPIWFGADDDSPTDIFCLICCGENMRHLHVLARLCMMIRDTDVMERIRTAEDEASLIESIYACENEVLAKLR